MDRDQLVLFQVELVNHPKISHPHPERLHPLHPMMGKATQVSSQFVNFTLQVLLYPRRQAEKTAVEVG